MAVIGVFWRGVFLLFQFGRNFMRTAHRISFFIISTEPNRFWWKHSTETELASSVWPVSVWPVRFCPILVKTDQNWCFFREIDRIWIWSNAEALNFFPPWPLLTAHILFEVHFNLPSACFSGKNGCFCVYLLIVDVYRRVS